MIGGRSTPFGRYSQAAQGVPCELNVVSSRVYVLPDPVIWAISENLSPKAGSLPLGFLGLEPRRRQGENRKHKSKAAIAFTRRQQPVDHSSVTNDDYDGFAQRN
jgi:hypothetical protein